MHIDDFMRKTTKYSRIELIKKEPAGVRAMSLNGKLKGRSQKRGSSAEQWKAAPLEKLSRKKALKEKEVDEGVK